MRPIRRQTEQLIRGYQSGQSQSDTFSPTQKANALGLVKYLRAPNQSHSDPNPKTMNRSAAKAIKPSRRRKIFDL